MEHPFWRICLGESFFNASCLGGNLIIYVFVEEASNLTANPFVNTIPVRRMLGFTWIGLYMYHGCVQETIDLHVFATCGASEAKKSNTPSAVIVIVPVMFVYHV